MDRMPKRKAPLESTVQAAIRKVLTENGWFSVKTHGCPRRNMVGWPDLFCFHPAHGWKCLEVKRGKGGKLEDSQVRTFGAWEIQGVPVWVCDDAASVLATLAGAPNWREWLTRAGT